MAVVLDVFLGSSTDRITSSLISSLASVSSTWEIISSPAVIQNMYVSQFLFRSRLQVLFLSACYPVQTSCLCSFFPSQLPACPSLCLTFHCWSVSQDETLWGDEPAMKGTYCMGLHRPELHPQPGPLQVNTHTASSKGTNVLCVSRFTNTISCLGLARKWTNQSSEAMEEAG